MEKFRHSTGGRTADAQDKLRQMDRSGRVRAEVIRDRTATFVFLVGARWFGVATVHVSGEEAAGYSFTSSLPVKVVRLLAPRMLNAFRPLPAGGGE